MADIKQIKVGDTTYNIEPVTSYYKVGRPDFEMNSSGSLKGYGGFIDFHFFNSSGQPLNSSGSVVSSTPDYTSRIIEDSAGCIDINGTYIAWTGLTSSYIKSNGSIDATTFNENGTSLANKYVTIGTSQTISGLKTFKGNESNDISFVYNGNSTISGYGRHTAIRHAISFPWYNDIYQIGNIRGDSADSLGFGITKGNNELVARFVDTSNAYIGNNKIIHSGNFVSGNSSNGEHNANNAITNGHYYYNSNGPATSLGASYTDGALYVQSHSDAWAGQIAQDYRNGSLFVRGKNNGSWSPWKRVIDSDNIGSQSVNYATSSHLLRTYDRNDSSHGADYYLKCRHNVDGNDRFKLQIVRTDGSVTHSTSVDYANSAGAATHSQYLAILASINGEDTNTYPWRRVMSIPPTTQNYTDTVGTYYLSGNYIGGPYYLFRVEFRTNHSAGGELGSFGISVIATNADPRDLAIASYSVVENGVTRNYSDIFIKVNCGWPRLTLTRLSVPDVGSITYYNSYEGVGASSRIAAYTGINGSGTGYASYELHAIAEYTYINYGAINSTFVTTNTNQSISGYKTISSIGIDTINGATLGNAIMRQNTSTGDVILGSTVRPLRLWGNGDKPTYSKDDGASYKNLALTSDIPTNYVTTDTTQTISGAKTFSKNLTVNSYIRANSLNTSYISYSDGATGLKIAGPWGNDEQAILEFASGKIRGYNWYDDGIDTTDLTLQFEFPAGVQMNANSSSMYLNGNSSCSLESTVQGWRVAGNDTYGCIYPAATHNGRVGLSTNHFYEGFINYIYANNIYPISTNGTSPGYNMGNVGSSSKYFSSGAFRTVYRSSESGLSDIRLKQNISNNDLNALEIINNLNIINFQYDDDIKIEARNKKQRLKAINTMKELPKTKETKELRKELQKIIATPNNEDMITIGVSAQQLQELLPKKYQKTFIQKESTNQYADQLFIRENRLVYLSFKAIQEQQAIIGSLEEKINLLEEKINALEEKMKKEVN